MHKIQEKEFTLDDFSTDHLLDFSWNRLADTIEHLNYCRENFINYDPEEEKIRHPAMQYEKKDYWWQMIQLLPSSYNQTRNVMMNYEVLANIYRQRNRHKLDEWRELCKWIESLPYSEVIIGFKEYDTVEYAKEHPDFADRIKDAVEKMTKSVPCKNKSEEDENNV